MSKICISKFLQLKRAKEDIKVIAMFTETEHLRLAKDIPFAVFPSEKNLSIKLNSEATATLQMFPVKCPSVYGYELRIRRMTFRKQTAIYCFHA